MIDIPAEVGAAVRMATTLGVFGGMFAWLAWFLGTTLGKRTAPLERRVIHGIGTGTVAGLVLGGFSLAA